MVLIEKGLAIRQVESIPILCGHCGQESTFGQPIEEVCDALVTASYIYQFQQELALLQRTQVLFNCFPNSRHQEKLAKEYVTSKRPRPQPDPRFEIALDKDTELKDFLRAHGFWLPARLKVVQESLVRWQEELDHKAIQCASCSEGCYHVEPDFFDRLV